MRDSESGFDLEGPGDSQHSGGVRWLGPIVLAMLVLGFFYQPLIRGRAFYVYDLSMAYLPVQVENARLRAQGEFPLWNQYLFMGYPINAEAESGGLYPPALVFNLPIAVERAYALYIVFHYVLAFMAVSILGRRAGLSRPARTLAGIVFAFGGTFVSQTVNLPLVTTFAWAPLILALQIRALQDRAIGPAVWAGVCLGVQILGMHPQMTFVTGLLIVLAALVRPGTDRRGGGIGFAMGTAGLIFLVGVGLGAPQFLYNWSMMDRLDDLPRETYAYITSLSFPPTYLLQLLIPDLLGTGDRYIGTEVIEEQRSYVGLIPLGLLIVGWRGGGRTWRFVRIVAVGSVILSLGHFVFVYRVLEYVPGFNLFRAPARWWLPASLAMGLLAGRGLDRLGMQAAGARGWTKRLGIFFAAIAVGLGGVALWARTVPDDALAAASSESPAALRVYARFCDWGIQNRPNHVRSYDPEKFNEILPAALADFGRSAGRSAIFAGLAAALFLVMSTTRWAGAAGLICVVLVGLDLWSAGSGWHKFAPAGFYGRTADHIERYRDDTSQFRVMSIVNRRDRDPDPAGLSSNFGSLYEIQVLDGFPSREFRTMNRFKDGGLTSAQLNMAGIKYLQFPFPVDLKSPPSQLAGLDLVAVEEGPDWYVYENRSVLPRAMVVSDYEVVKDENALFGLLKSPAFDPRRTVLLSGEPACEGMKSVEDIGAHSAQITEYEGQRVTIRTESDTGGVLVLFDFFYPGWRATVDGERAEILEANGVFRGVCVPAGAHEIVFRYRPVSFYVGLVVAAITLLGLAVWAANTRRRRPG